MADNFGGGENIFYTEDSNVVLIDPNSITNSQGKRTDRVIKQENLIMYANLEAETVPRTKLAVGQDIETGISNVNIASINFLKPQDKDVFDTSYTDAATGFKSSQGIGINQIKFGKSGNPQQPNYVDTQVLGIRDISVNIKFNGVPQVNMVLVDVQGKSLFQTGGNSAYSAFLYYPYPMFRLTLKGFYGKAIQYQLMLENFQASFDAQSGNYIVNLKFIARTSAMLDDVRLGFLYALPHMYLKNTIPNTEANDNNTLSKATASNKQNGDNITNNLTVQTNSRGYSKIKEVFDLYKQKGLIDQNVPVTTINEMSIILQKYTQFLNQEFDKLDFTNIVAITRYQESLNNLVGSVRDWYGKYLNNTEGLSLNSTYDNLELYPLLNLTNANSDNQDSNLKLSADSESNLTQILNTYKKQLLSIPKYGSDISLNEDAFNINFFKQKFSENDIDFELTYINQTGRQVENPATDGQFITFKNTLLTNLKNNKTLTSVEDSSGISITEGNRYYYVLKNFLDYTNGLNVQVLEKYNEEANRLKEVLKSKAKNNGNVQDLSFRPTVRNIIGTIMASVDAFYRLMDDVHKTAWNQRTNKTRLKSILSTNTPSQEGKDVLQTIGNNPNYFVYPWPQFVQKKETSNKVNYEVTYPGARGISNQTQAYNYTIWPEVEFVEEYLKSVLEKDKTFDNNVLPNTETVLKYSPEHAIEYPLKDVVYKSESVVDFMYEIYERLYLNTFYSGYYYYNTNQDLIQTATEIEQNNIVNLNVVNPELRDILSNTIPKDGLYNYLKTTSNNQTGELWTGFTSQNFVTNYIKNYVNNSWGVFPTISATTANPIKVKSIDNIIKFTESTESDKTTLFDTFPFVIDSFGSNMAGSPTIPNRYTTINSYSFLENQTILSTKGGSLPLTRTSSGNEGYAQSQVTRRLINEFYNDRTTSKTKKFITEGGITYTTDNNLVKYQTTSLLNTPYFLNAINEAANSTGSEANAKLTYLFLNSLPLSTLYEKMIDKKDSSDKDYIFSTLNKFSAIHTLPYAWILKMGSVWYRYKKYVETNVDILTSVWNNFDYKLNYDPTSSDPNKQYDVCVDGNLSSKKPFILESDNSIQSGFYPKLINSVYKLITGGQLFTDYNEINNLPNNFYDKFKISSNNKPTNSLNGGITSYFTYLTLDTENVEVLGPKYVNNYIVFPSAGYTPFEQAYYEITNSDDGTVNINDLKGNESLYNGSARSFWKAPNYGWFDNSKVTKPAYNEYLKLIKNDNTKENKYGDFDITNQYSSIEDLFGVFTKEQLDFFENEFLLFSQEDGKSTIFTENQIDNTYSNMLNILKKMFVVKSTSTDSKDIANEQASQITDVLNKFLDINVYLKIGNPKKLDRVNFGYFSNDVNLTPKYFIPYSKYSDTPNRLPKSGIVTYSQSIAQYPNEWKSLLTNVGFSSIDGIKYGETSTIYDFFTDNDIGFTVENIQNLSQLIKIYATNKQLNPSYNKQTFQQDLKTILNVAYTKRQNIEKQVFNKLPSLLINQKQVESGEQSTKLNGDNVKLEQWELFKSINDKWISGMDFSKKLIFEEFLFLDKSNKDIGDELIINTDSIRKYCNYDNAGNSIMALIRQIIADNRMNFFVMPAYINFYGKASYNTTERNQSILNNANDTFSTYTYVDYIDSSPKFLCQYIDRPSQTLSLGDNPNYPFKSDSFDLGNKSTDNPIINTDKNINQYRSNKAVGFVVDFGTINQSIFTSVEINQEQGVTSSEQIQTIIDMGQQAAGKKTLQQTTSLYDFYKNRSYTCKITTIGNAMIQPTMYFVLRHIPMFNGTYIIRNVSHSISSGKFVTIFEGQRVSSTINAKVSEDLATVNEDFSKQLSDKVTQFVSNNTLVTLNTENVYLTNQDSKNYVLSSVIPYQGFINSCTDNLTQDCFENINSVYSNMTNSDFTKSTITLNNLCDIIKTKTGDNKNLAVYLLSLIYLMGNDTDSKEFTYYLNNIYGVTCDIDRYQASLKDKIKKYRCLTTNENTTRPFVSFESVEDNIQFLVDYYKDKSNVYLNVNNKPIDFNDSATKTQSINKVLDLYYNSWYTSGQLPKSYIEDPKYSDWVLTMKYVLTIAKNKNIY